MKMILWLPCTSKPVAGSIKIRMQVSSHNCCVKFSVKLSIWLSLPDALCTYGCPSSSTIFIHKHHT